MPELTVSGPNEAAVSYRFDQDAVRIGRAASCDLVLEDPAASRVHAELQRSGEGWVLVDRDSRNGVRLNDRPVGRPTPVRPGDRIELGDTVIVFEARPEPRPNGAEAPTVPHTWSARGNGVESDEEIVGTSPALRRVLSLVERLAPTTLTVLVTGATGTGKELIAHRLHRLSPRATGPFVVVNCPALPGSLLESELFGVEKGVATGVEARRGRLEAAHGGTLLLDEIGDLDLAAQAKLLRFLQERSLDRVGGRTPIAIDARVIAATNEDLAAAVAAGRFRRDLYHRLKVATIELPPLSARAEDIPLLVRHFLARPEGPRIGIDPEALAALARRSFTGNVRELENLVEALRFTAAGAMIRVSDLPPDDAAASAAPASAAPAVTGSDAHRLAMLATLFERVVRGGESFWDLVHAPFLGRELSREDAVAIIERARAEGDGSYRAAARVLGIEADYKRLLNVIDRHGLRPDGAPRGR